MRSLVVVAIATSVAVPSLERSSWPRHEGPSALLFLATGECASRSAKMESSDGRVGIPTGVQAPARRARRDGPTRPGAVAGADLCARKVTFGTADNGDVESFVVDPVPRVIAREEWRALAAGLAQRARALDRFVADVYGPRRIVAAGRVPWSAIESADHYEPRMADLPPASGRWIAIAGLDVVRDGDGPYIVLEDNVRTPSGSPTRSSPARR